MRTKAETITGSTASGEFNLSRSGAGSFHLSGTWGGGSVTVEGSLDEGTTWDTLTQSDGTDATYSDDYVGTVEGFYGVIRFNPSSVTSILVNVNTPG